MNLTAGQVAPGRAPVTNKILHLSPFFLSFLHLFIGREEQCEPSLMAVT